MCFRSNSGNVNEAPYGVKEPAKVASTVSHELGHNLGLHHAGTIGGAAVLELGR